jgi:hypothetical protein
MKIVESVDIFDQGIDIVYRERSNKMLLCNPPRPCPDRVWMERWSIVDGKLVLSETKEGTHTPAQYVPESITLIRK